MTNHYTAVTYSGSTCMCGTLRHTNNECGHKHRTEEAAQTCLTKLQNWSDDGRNCSATWYHGGIESRNAKGDTVIDNYDDSGNHTGQISAQAACRC